MPPSHDTMRVVRWVAFVDLCGFTAFTEANGDQSAVEVLHELRAALRRRAEVHGVRVTKWLGDGAMLSAVQAADLLATVVEVRDHVAGTGPLALRAGICGGPVIMFEGDDYVGAAVNAAARLCDYAAPGQVLCAANALRAAGEPLPSRALGSISMPGIEADLEIVELAPGDGPAEQAA
jgi:adenylate cyclase